MLSVRRDDLESRFFRVHLFRVVLQPNIGTSESVVLDECSLSVWRFNRSFLLMQFKQEISPEVLWSKDRSLLCRGIFVRFHALHGGIGRREFNSHSHPNHVRVRAIVVFGLGLRDD